MVQAVALVSLQHIFLNVDASVESIHWMSFCLTKRWRPRQTTRKAEEGTFVHDYVRDIVQLRVILQATKKYAFSNGTHEPSKQLPLKIRPWQSTVFSPDTLVDICRQQIARILYIIYISHQLWHVPPSQQHLKSLWKYSRGKHFVHDHKANKWPRLLNILIWSHTEWRPKRACGANQDLGSKGSFGLQPDSVAH